MTFGVNAPRGLQPVDSGAGHTWNGQTNQYPITSGYASPLYTGDLVSLGTAGTVIRAVASTAALGVFMGCEYQTNTNQYNIRFPYWPSGQTVKTGTTAYAYVIDDPRVRYTVQETDAAGASGTPLTQADVGNNANVVFGTGSTQSGLSGLSLNNASVATTLVGNLKIVGLDPGIQLGIASTSGTPGGQQTIGTPFQNWIVEVNNDVYKAGSARP